MNLKKHHLFFAAIPIVLIYTLAWSNSALDIQMFDTYIVIAHSQLGIFVSILFGFFAFVYWLFEKKNIRLNKWLSVIHIIVTFVFFAFLLANVFRPYPFHYVEGTGAAAEYFQKACFVFYWLILLFVFGQLLFLVNVVIGILKGRT